jgi:hypothetical protein
MPAPMMPSLPPFDGVAVPYCAGIHAESTTIRAIDAFTGVDGKSLSSIKLTGEHKIFSSCLYINGGGKLSDGCTSDAVGPSGSIRLFGKGVNGTLACPTGGVNTIIFSTYHHKNGGGIFADGSASNAIGPSGSIRPLGTWVDGTHTHIDWGCNAIAVQVQLLQTCSVCCHLHRQAQGD